MLLTFRKLKTAFSLGLAVLCCLGIYSLQKPNLNRNPQKNPAAYTRQEQIAKTRLQVLKEMPSFGFSNLIADWAYLNFIQYYGDREARKETDYSLAPDYFEVIVDRDPRFAQAHLTLSTATSVYAGEPKKSVAYLEKSLQFLSPEINKDANFVWSYKGTDELLFLGDVEAAQKSFAMAAKWGYARGDELGRVIANRHQETAQFLADNPDSKKAQVRAWGTVLSNVADEETRQDVIEEIRSLGGDVVETQRGYRIISPEEETKE